MILMNVMITLKFFPGFQRFSLILGENKAENKAFLLVKELITNTQVSLDND